MNSLTSTAHGDADGSRQGRSRACSSYHVEQGRSQRRSVTVRTPYAGRDSAASTVWHPDAGRTRSYGERHDHRDPPPRAAPGPGVLDPSAAPRRARVRPGLRHRPAARQRRLGRHRPRRNPSARRRPLGTRRHHDRAADEPAGEPRRRTGGRARRRGRHADADAAGLTEPAPAPTATWSPPRRSRAPAYAGQPVVFTMTLDHASTRAPAPGTSPRDVAGGQGDLAAPTGSGRPRSAAARSRSSRWWSARTSRPRSTVAWNGQRSDTDCTRSHGLGRARATTTRSRRPSGPTRSTSSSSCRPRSPRDDHRDADPGRRRRPPQASAKASATASPSATQTGQAERRAVATAPALSGRQGAGAGAQT